MALERMASFFDVRVDGYDEHMKSNIDGGDLMYKETVKHLPQTGVVSLLDLGCGTGLELDVYFEVNPRAEVTGYDLSVGMTSRLLDKHQARKHQITVCNEDYLKADFGHEVFEAAVSVQSAHHFLEEDKLALYKKVYRSLKPGASYVETDYMAPDEAYEAFYVSEYQRIKNEERLGSGLFHYDLPMTVNKQFKLLKASGFRMVEKVWQVGNTVTLVAYK